MADKSHGGIIHAYQKYDPVNFPRANAESPDVVSAAFEHLLQYGDTNELTEEELANAVKIDPSQIAGLGPSLDALIKMLEERKRKILEKYEVDSVSSKASQAYTDTASRIQVPKEMAKPYKKAVESEQLYDLEQLYYRAASVNKELSTSIVKLADKLAQKYQIDEMSAKYDWKGKEVLDIPEALELYELLKSIDRLLEQLREAKKSARVGIIDLEELAQFASTADIEALNKLNEQIQEYLKREAEEQGITGNARQGFEISPKAYRLFQSKILSKIFENLKASRTGRHDPITAEGAVESITVKDYEFGDSISNIDMPSTILNSLANQRYANHSKKSISISDLVIHKTKTTPKAATCVILDMSGSMRYNSLYVNVKKMGLALDGLIRSEYPGDYLQFIEMYTLAKTRHVSDIPSLMPKPVTIYDPVVRLKADLSNPEITEYDLPWHFTNIQHALSMARRHLASQPSQNKNIMLVTDGLPTAHFEGSELYMIYPPSKKTEDITLREAGLCAAEGITINIFLLSTWNQTSEDIRFAYKMAEQMKGRVVFAAGRDLDRYVIWDYIARKRSLIA